ncbi:hypothetical protein AT15_07635 [Kosmotoga arenicorallina S304]|uniref:Polymerase/histidinol phosphatase N-terminal domain-containing protein n=1 Tax=Kosmotoga arenicorallina S304 TaxID=1453497 RepID=A0A182C775_9BACT|nr:PHP domain-containing protein [Kosmotoga arenicorallina]OAA31359.1 hypothetical protein AT15_07635 [Kosmotoga arenicorallina S304]
MLIDLHVHSTYSDGTKSVDEILNIMKGKNIRLFSITDHDNLKAQKEAINLAMKNGLNYIPGVEISCKFSGGTMDILGYNIDCDMEDLNEFLNKLVEHRNKRNVLIIRKLNELGLDINMEEVINESGGTVIGRPHISRALLRKGYVKSIQDAFEMYIGKGKIAYVSKNKHEPEEVIFHIKKAGGIAVLAHPLSLNLEYGSLERKVGELVDAGLQGIEVFYKAYSDEEQEKLLAIAKKFHLLVTGGSDYHGDNKPDIEPGTEIQEEFLKDFLEELSLQRLLSQS